MIWVPFLETSIYLLMSHKHHHIYDVINIYGRSLLMVFVRDIYEDFPMPCLIEGRLYDPYSPWYIMLYWLYLVYVGIICVYIERYTCWVILVVVNLGTCTPYGYPGWWNKKTPRAPRTLDHQPIARLHQPLSNHFNNVYQTSISHIISHESIDIHGH